jgi:hypothetical protein
MTQLSDGTDKQVLHDDAAVIEANFVALAEPDKDRMARLYEEIQARLVEMSLIMTRTLGTKITPDTVFKFEPRIRQAGVSSVFGTKSVEVHCTETSPGHFECGCYDNEAGTCGPC